MPLLPLHLPISNYLQKPLSSNVKTDIADLQLPAAGEEEDLDLGKMVREGEVAWLHKRDMPGTGHAEHAEDSNLQAWHGQKQSPPSPQQGGARKRKEPPPGRHSQPASRPSSAQPAPLKQGQHCCQIVHLLTSLFGCSTCCRFCMYLRHSWAPSTQRAAYSVDNSGVQSMRNDRMQAPNGSDSISHYDTA